MVSSSHAVCAKGLFIAMVSTLVETDKPELEIRPAIDLLGDILEMFVQIHTLYEPTDDGRKDNVISFKVINVNRFSLLKVMMLLLTLRVQVTKYWRCMKESQGRSLTSISSQQKKKSIDKHHHLVILNIIQ